MEIFAPAKLNLCLFLGPRREDGLHSLCSLFEPLALGDVISVVEADRDEVICPGVEGENLATKALAALRKKGWAHPPTGSRSRSGRLWPRGSGAAARTQRRSSGSRPKTWRPWTEWRASRPSPRRSERMSPRS